MNRAHLQAVARLGALEKESNLGHPDAMRGIVQAGQAAASPSTRQALLNVLKTFFGKGGPARSGAAKAGHWATHNSNTGKVSVPKSIASGLTAGGVALGGASGASHLLSSIGDGYEPSGNPLDDGGKPSNIEHPFLLGVGAGAGTGGLASLVYGKLANKPDLQRDLISALAGAAVGGTYGAYTKNKRQEANPVEKAASLNKEAMHPALIALYTFLAGTSGVGAYQSHKAGKRGDEALQQGEAALAKTDALSAEQAAARKSSDRLTGAGIGLAGGAAAGGLASAGYGHVTGKENLRRDLLAALAGSAAGGLAGAVYGPGKFNKAPEGADPGTANA